MFFKKPDAADQRFLRPLKIQHVLPADLVEHRNVGAQHRNPAAAGLNQRQTEALPGGSLQQRVRPAVSLVQRRVRRAFQHQQPLSVLRVPAQPGNKVLHVPSGAADYAQLFLPARSPQAFKSPEGQVIPFPGFNGPNHQEGRGVLVS